MNITTNGHTSTVTINEFTPETYQQFLACKMLPRYQIDLNSQGHYEISFPTEYAERLGIDYHFEFEPLPLELPHHLFDREQVAVKIGWKKERYAFLWRPGLGKTSVYLELARQLCSIGNKTIICAPLNTLHQIIEMAFEYYGNDFPHIINLHDRHKKNQPVSTIKEFVHSEACIAVVNHEFFNKPRNLTGIDCFILDESSILKNGTGTQSKNLRHSTKGIRYKYAMSGTQSPNNRAEYALLAEFLEMVRSETEFIGMFFIQKDKKKTNTGTSWMLRHHCHDKFYDFLASFCMFMYDPTAYGFVDNLGLKPYKEIAEKVPMTQEQLDIITKESNLTQLTMSGTAKRPKTFRNRSLYKQVSRGFWYERDEKGHNYVGGYVESEKVNSIVKFVSEHPDRKSLVFVEFDEEGEILYRTLSESGRKAALISGKTPMNQRIEIIDDFRHGKYDDLIGKSRMIGMGLNLHAASMVIISGIKDSWELFFQSILRAWRYPQTEKVLVYIPYTEYESVVLQNVLQKRDTYLADFKYQEYRFVQSGLEELQEYLDTDFIPVKKEDKMYDPVITENYQLYHTDSIEATLNGLAENSIDLIVTSIPFRNDIFAYTESVSDLGNSGGVGQAGRYEFMAHLKYSLLGMYKTLKPGRICCIEISQSPLRQGVDGVIGMSDFRGDVIRLAEETGFFQFGEIPVLENPQAASIIKHLSTLAMRNVRDDRAKLAPMYLDFILIFKKPGINETPVTNKMIYVNLDEFDQEPIETSEKAKYIIDQAEIFWQEYQRDSTTTEWPLMIIDNKLQDRLGNIPQAVYTAYSMGFEKPSFVTDDWSIPVEIADVTNEGHIENADGFWQEREFNRTAMMHNATKQLERFGQYFESAELEFDKLAQKIHEIENGINAGEYSASEAMQVLFGAFYDIQQSDTLNTPYNKGANIIERSNSEKHIAPFSLPLVDRIIRFWSNRGDTVLDPYGGIGTVPVKALELDRKAIAMELKDLYFLKMADFCKKETSKPKQLTLF